MTLTIDRLAYGGDGVGRVDGYVVFVPLTAPGDRVSARLWKTGRRHGSADLLEILEPSPDRVDPPCPVFGRCGGCAWQHLPYAVQLATKADILRDSLERIGGLRDLPYREIIGAPAELRYRNKMEFAFHPEAGLGLHLRGAFDRVLELDDCLLPSERAAAILRDVKAFVRERGISCWDKKTHEGFLRHLVVREAKSTGEIMVAIVTTSGDFPEAEDLAARLVELDPDIASVLWARTDAVSDSVLVDSLTVLHGRDHIVEELGGVKFDIHLETFFQTNTAAAQRLASCVLELSAPQPTDKFLDVYCGVGAFTLLLAPHVEHAWGVEVVERSIEAARHNAKRAGIGNTTFHVGDARRTLPAVLDEIGAPPDLVVVDPPRSGVGGKVMRRLGRSRAERIVYVSCNPTTLAPDLKQLIPYGYEVEAVQPIDLFPQTYHLETVVLLRRVREPDEGVR